MSSDEYGSIIKSKSVTWLVLQLYKNIQFFVKQVTIISISSYEYSYVWASLFCGY